MAMPKVTVPPVPHQCPLCHAPQVKIQRVLGGAKHGAISYVCVQSGCGMAIDLRKVDTWVAV
jgi:hypothetical protein